jgi:hypothetical protein
VDDNGKPIAPTNDNKDNKAPAIGPKK